ncbi:hypothetical protein V1514DRAFT_330113 [Lipomyces japonicus]|uniref:uncharacterized protein n=1 Tax=Lipomyces japonicus TaxID=56871 RepID=UPI0034CF8012
MSCFTFFFKKHCYQQLGRLTAPTKKNTMVIIFLSADAFNHSIMVLLFFLKRERVQVGGASNRSCYTTRAKINLMEYQNVDFFFLFFFFAVLPT